MIWCICKLKLSKLRRVFDFVSSLIGDKGEIGVEDDGILSTFYRTERNLRHALQPTYEVLFERLNTHPGGLKFLTVLRADILSTIK